MSVHKTGRDTGFMEEVALIGINLAKNVFHLHGAPAEGRDFFRKKLTRP